MSDNVINKVQQNIKELQDQNAIDFQNYELLSQKIEEIKETIKLTDNHLNLLIKKIKADYENLKKIIIDENIQLQLNNKIEENTQEINKIKEQLNNTQAN